MQNIQVKIWIFSTEKSNFYEKQNSAKFLVTTSGVNHVYLWFQPYGLSCYLSWESDSEHYTHCYQRGLEILLDGNPSNAQTASFSNL